jgi:small basic protein (TIGR04137 family)
VSSAVTIDKSLKRKGRLARTRNVLQRHERIAQMKADDKWQDTQSPLGLPKLRVVKLVVGKKKKKAAAAEAGKDDKKKAAKKK